MKKRYEDLPIDLYKQKKAEYETRGLEIPDGEELEPTDWAEQNGVAPRNKRNLEVRTFIKVGNARKQGRIKVLASDNTQPTYYWAGFWQKKGTRTYF